MIGERLLVGAKAVRAFLFCAALFAFGPAAAQTSEPASPELINGEARYLELDGPEPGERRAIYVWRAPNTPGDQLLPTLYMADGAPGLYVAIAKLREAIEAGVVPPIQIIGLNPNTDRDRRTSEYAERGRHRFRAHERWVLDVVIPWAERVARADPQRRFVGGYSNGAAFAIYMGAAHPNVFSGVLAHSPVAAAETFRAARGVGRVRWAMSAGRLEYGGYPAGAISVVAAEVRGDGAEVRLCRGAWGHDPVAWIDLSPGSIAWLVGTSNYADVSTPLEQESCETDVAP